MTNASTAREPLPIWVFVGVILFTYGVIVLVAGIIGDERVTVLQELRPALWWGGVRLVAGAALGAIGLVSYRRAERAVTRDGAS
jgi:uncharacterized membrane protein